MKIVLNNKCNFTKNEFDKYIEELQKIKSNVELILCPSMIYLSNIKNTNISIGSQDVSRYEIGPHTGEISATQLNSIGVRYTIVGHHERIIECKETVEEIKEKITNLLNCNIIPILCIDGNDILIKLNKIFDHLTLEQIKKIIIVYEPSWCIRTGMIPTIKDIESTISLIKNKYKENEVLYGGSVNLDTIDKLKKISILDGYIIGDMSLYPKALEKFINKIEI